MIVNRDRNLIFLVLPIFFFSGCNNWLNSYISGQMAPATIAPPGGSSKSLTVTAPTTVINSSNLFNFTISGSCKVGDTLNIVGGGTSQAISCGGAGTWNSTIDLGGAPDGSVALQVSSVSEPSTIANLTLTKTTMSCPGGPTTFTTNMNARYVLGQANFVSNAANRGGPPAANTLSNPMGVVVHNGRLYVADGNNRVLVFNSLPTANGVNADQVIGQVDFNSSVTATSQFNLNGVQQIAVTGNYLAVGEWSSARVSLWPLNNPVAASFVLGQPNFTSNTVNFGGSTTAQTSGAVAGIAFGGNRLFTGDVSNNRVMMYDPTNFSTMMAGINVIGQPVKTSSAPVAGLNGVQLPFGISTDGTKLAIMDNNNDRVLIYNSIPTADGVSANVEWGSYGISSTGLNNAVGVFIGDGKLFIADRGSDRVLVFNSIPTGPSVPADAVLGQAVFTSQDHNQCNCATAAANTMWGVHHVYWDGCRLYVTDRQNHRVLIF